MRSQDEIVSAMRAMIDAGRPMEAEYGVLLPCLDWEHARSFLKPEATEAAWVESGELTLTEEQVMADAAACLEGVWGSITDHDRAVTERTLGNVRAYVWLLGDDRQRDAFDARSDHPFGGPKFLWAATVFRLPLPETTQAARMASGQPCWGGCTEGCIQ